MIVRGESARDPRVLSMERIDRGEAAQPPSGQLALDTRTSAKKGQG
jgi:hypothetical protein